MTPRTILHIDMDAFFASVEVRDNPALVGKPVLVGGQARRGVVAAASYEARKFGAKSAMPIAEALRRCPEAVVVPPRHGRYEEVSDQVFTIFHRFTPLVEGLSLDEAFLDVTASESLFGSGEIIAEKIRSAIATELQLTASAGVAPCKFAAKIASDLNKPDGLFVIHPDKVAETLGPLPLERMWGIGPKAATALRAAKYATIGDLARSDPSALERLLGSWGSAVHLLAQGIDDRAVEPNRDPKSIGAEETYDTDLSSYEELEASLLSHASRIARRLTVRGWAARTLTLKLKEHNFRLHTRQVTLDDAVSDTGSLMTAAKELLARFPLEGKRFRLTGLSAGSLEREGHRPSLFPDAAASKRKVIEQTMLRIDQRFPGAVSRAAIADKRRS